MGPIIGHIPDLQFDYPPCQVCDGYGQMSYDDGFYCEECGTTWNRDGTGGEESEARDEPTIYGRCDVTKAWHKENPDCVNWAPIKAECEHLSATGVDQAEGDDKVWRCDGCGRLYRTVTENGITRMLFGVIPSDIKVAG